MVPRRLARSPLSSTTFWPTAVPVGWSGWELSSGGTVIEPSALRTTWTDGDCMAGAVPSAAVEASAAGLAGADGLAALSLDAHALNSASAVARAASFPNPIMIDQNPKLRPGRAAHP